MLRILILSITIVFLFHFDIIAQEDTTLRNDSQWIGLSFINAQSEIFSSPFSIKKNDLKYLIPITAATTLAIMYDEDINRNIIKFKNENSLINKLSPVFTFGGEIPFVAGTSGLMYFTGLALKDDKLLQTGAIAAFALINSAVVISVLKMTFGRQRPNFDGTSKWHFFPESLKQFDGEKSEKYTSFPSGHSIAAWTLASVVSEQYKEIRYIPIIAYTFATGVSLSRMTENAHWLSDVIIGSALGYGIGKFTAKKHKNTSWYLFPSENGGKLTITGIYRF